MNIVLQILSYLSKFLLTTFEIDLTSIALELGVSYIVSTLPMGTMFLIMTGIDEYREGFHREGLLIIIPSILGLLVIGICYMVGWIY